MIVFLVQTVKYFQTAHVSKGTLPDDKNNNYFLEINKPLNRQAKTVRGFWLLMKSFTVIMFTDKKVQLYSSPTVHFFLLLFSFALHNNEYFKIEPQAIWMITRRHPDAGNVKEVLYREVSKAAQIDNTPTPPPLSSIIHGLKWVDQCTKRIIPRSEKLETTSNVV